MWGEVILFATRTWEMVRPMDGCPRLASAGRPAASGKRRPRGQLALEATARPRGHLLQRVETR